MSAATMQAEIPVKTEPLDHRALRMVGKRASSDESQDERLLDSDLVDRVMAGDPSAFTDLYLKYRTSVQRFVLSRVADESEAEDITQDTFVEAYRSIGSFQGRSRLLTWLLGIARHRCMQFYRFGSRWMIGAHSMDATLDRGFDPRIEAHVDAMLTLARCHETLHRLRSPAARSIFYLHYHAGLSVREIAEVVEKSIDAVKASLSRSRRVLERSMPGFGGDLALVDGRTAVDFARRHDRVEARITSDGSTRPSSAAHVSSETESVCA